MRAKRCNSPRGQSLVEWAFILPILLLIVFVIVDFGRMVFTYSALYNAVREGARYATIHPTDTSGIQAKVEHYAVSLDPAQMVVSFPAPPDTHRISVRATYQFTLVTPFTAVFFGSDTIPLQAQTTMQREN
jgi:Flp pilus assembly protein TadG